MTKTDLEEGIDAHNKGNYQTALRKLDPLAKGGNPDAQFYMGQMCEFGRGISKNPKKAWNWYAKASEQGHVEAQKSLARMDDNKRIWGWYN